MYKYLWVISIVIIATVVVFKEFDNSFLPQLKNMLLGLSENYKVLVKLFAVIAIVSFIAIMVFRCSELGYDRQVVFWAAIVTMLLFGYFLKHIGAEPLDKKLLEMFKILVIAIPIMAFVFQYWPSFTLEGVEDVGFYESNIAPEKVILDKMVFNEKVSKDAVSGDALKSCIKEYLSACKNIPKTLPTRAGYTLKNCSQAIVTNVETRYKLVSLGGGKKPVTISEGRWNKLTFAPLESRSFLVDFEGNNRRPDESMTKKDLGYNHIFLLVYVKWHPMLFPLKQSCKYLMSYADENRLWAEMPLNTFGRPAVDSQRENADEIEGMFSELQK